MGWLSPTPLSPIFAWLFSSALLCQFAGEFNEIPDHNIADKFSETHPEDHVVFYPISTCQGWSNAVVGLLANGKDLSTGEIAKAIGRSVPRTSNILGALRLTEVVRYETDGRYARY